jgi:hypothetical protein
MADYGLQRLIIQTTWQNLEWTIHSFVGINYPSLQEFGLELEEEEEDDFATLVQEEDAKGGMAFLERMLAKNAQTEWLPSFWHVNKTFTHPNGSTSQGKFVIETYNARVQLIISYHHGSFWVDVIYTDPTLTHTNEYIKHIGDKDMRVWCIVVNPDGAERGLPLADLPAMLRHWNEGVSMPYPKQYPFVGMGL